MRAAVLIGVDRAGKLTELNAASNAEDMAEWARLQGADIVETITDREQPVTPGVVAATVSRLVRSGQLDQLLIYFSGHGVNRNYCEYWLLSDAPEDGNAAINVGGSIARAWNCGVPHVVFMSDACRSAATSLQAQAIDGSLVIPNIVGAQASNVDVFYACSLGDAAAEIKDDKDSAARYEAVYTKVLLDALHGRIPSVTDRDKAPPWYVRPRKLGAYLKIEVAKAAFRQNIMQVPEARVTSDENGWISLLKALPDGPDATPRFIPPPAPNSPRFEGESPRKLESFMQESFIPGAPAKRFDAREPASFLRRAAARGAGSVAVTPADPNVSAPHEVASALLDCVLRGASDVSIYDLLETHAVHSPSSRPLLRTLSTLLHVWDQPGSLSSFACGFELSGIRLTHAYALSAIRMHKNALEISGTLDAPAQVMLVMRDGRALVLPAFPGYVASVIGMDRQIVGIAYEASTVAGQRKRRMPSRDQRRLRAVVAALARHGELDMGIAGRKDLIRFSRRISIPDPALALHVAYALNEYGSSSIVEAIAAAQKLEFGDAFFDFELLARHSSAEHPLRAHQHDIPLYSRGWSLLGAKHAQSDLRDKLAGQVDASLWTLFNPNALPLLKAALFPGDES